MAATLATGGYCPTTNEVILHQDTVKNCLQILLSCGMYDYSGEWACTTGLPAKSGVSGSIFVSIPNVMGLAVWSPKLDSRGNSYRGVQFCTKVAQQFGNEGSKSFLISFPIISH
jgi:glutaminase